MDDLAVIEHHESAVQRAMFNGAKQAAKELRAEKERLAEKNRQLKQRLSKLVKFCDGAVDEVFLAECRDLIRENV
jgi:predicted nuclease with TOPRIM domain